MKRRRTSANEDNGEANYVDTSLNDQSQEEFSYRHKSRPSTSSIGAVANSSHHTNDHHDKVQEQINEHEELDEQEKQDDNNNNNNDEQENNVGDDDDVDDDIDDEDDDEDDEDEDDDGQEEPIEHEAGIIESIHVNNFMCHKRLEVKLGTCVNVITGENGSGKSAILTAIQICLGAKSSTTHRGSKLKDMIKSGEDFALITIRLRNQGKDAYQKNKYGNTIIVERRIDKNSSSTYKIKSENGKIISKKFSDLKIILHQFNIHIDNPCTVLTQDTSRQFLASSTPGQKYKFFLQATQLKSMVESFDLTSQNKDNLDKALRLKQEAMRESTIELERLKNEKEEAEKIEQINQEIEKLTDEIAWATVYEKREELERFQKKLEEEEQRLQQSLKKIEEEQKQIQNFEERKKELNDQLSKSSEKIKEISDKISECEKKIFELEKKKQTCNSQIGEKKRRMNIIDQKINQIQQRIKEQRERAEVDKSSEKKKREETLQKETINLKSLEVSYDKEKNEYKKIELEYGEVKENFKREVLERSNIHSKLDRISKKIKDLENQKIDKVNTFGNDTRKILNLLKQNKNRFEQLPIGPVGLLLTVKDLKWAAAIELALKSSLGMFILNSYKDFEIFKSILKTHKIREPVVLIFSHTTQAYDISTKRPDPSKFSTMKGMLMINDTELKNHPLQYDRKKLETTIFNALLDQHSIEKIILVDDLEKAQDIIFSGHRSPQNVGECYTPTGTRIYRKGSSKVVIGKNVQSKFWTADLDAEINNLKEEQKQLSQSWRQTSENGKRLEEHKKKLESILSEKNKIISTLRKDISKIESNINEIRNEPDEEEEDLEEIIQSYEESIQERLKEKQIFENSCNKIQEDAAKIQEQIEQMKKEKAEIVKEERLLKQQSDNISNSLSDILKHLMNNSNKKTRCEEAAKKHKNNVKLLEMKKKECQHSLELATMNAEEIHHDPVETTRSTKDIIREKEYKEITRKKEMEKFGNRSVDDILRDYSHYKLQHDERKRNLDESAACLENIKDGLKDRVSKFESIRLNFSSKTSEKFNVFLTKKGHSGSLHFSHEKETLETKVNLNPNFASDLAENKASTNTKSLSGGERSFTTVAFLLALWEVVEQPFRALDEIDIYMDSLYRQKAMELIIDHALQHKSRQFIIITPHDTSLIKPGPHVKLIRLHPPERSGLVQQSLDQYRTSQ